MSKLLLARRRMIRPGGSAALALDASTPPAPAMPGAQHGAVTSASFSPPAGSVLLVWVGETYTGQVAPTVSDSKGLTWTLQVSRNGGLEDRTSFFTAYNASAGAMTVTANDASVLGIAVFTGAAAVQNGAVYSGGATSGSVITTKAGSRCFLGTSNWNNDTVPSPNAGSTLNVGGGGNWTRSGGGSNCGCMMNVANSGPAGSTVAMGFSGTGGEVVMYEVVSA